MKTTRIIEAFSGRYCQAQETFTTEESRNKRLKDLLTGSLSMYDRLQSTNCWLIWERDETSGNCYRTPCSVPICVPDGYEEPAPSAALTHVLRVRTDHGSYTVNCPSHEVRLALAKQLARDPYFTLNSRWEQITALFLADVTLVRANDWAYRWSRTRPPLTKLSEMLGKQLLPNSKKLPAAA